MKIFKIIAALWIIILSSEIFSQAPNISSIPDSINVMAVYGTAVSDSFYIANTGDADLHYNLFDYNSLAIGLEMLHENDFSIFPGTDYTNSNWTSLSGGAQVTGNNLTGVLISPQFSTLDCEGFYLAFDQNFFYQPGSYSKVEYNNGSGWSEVYFQNADSSTAHQKIELPSGPTGQLRFTGYTTKVTGNTAFWFIDNIEVVGSWHFYYDCSWLTINSPIEGIVTHSDSTLIRFTCDASGLQTGRHWVNIVIESDDPDEPEKKITVHFDIILGTPLNVNTYIENDLLFVTWDEVAGADSYDIYWADDPYGPFAYFWSTQLTSCAISTYWAKKFFYVVAKSDE